MNSKHHNLAKLAKGFTEDTFLDETERTYIFFD